MRRIAEYAHAIWGPELARDARRWFSMSSHSPASLRRALPAFDSWFAFVWTANWEDEFSEVPETWPTGPLGVEWLASGTAKTSAFDQTVVMTATRSPYSLLLVETVTAGWSLGVRDLITGRRFLVVDPEVSAHADPDTILVSAVLTLDGVSTLLGPAPYAIPPDWRFEAAELRKCYAHDGPWLTREELADCEDEIWNVYLDACNRAPMAAHIRLDSDTDPYDPLLLRWTVTAAFDDVLERLRPLTRCFTDEEAIDLSPWPNGDPQALLTWYRRGLSIDPDDWEIIGFLYLEEGRLAADVPTQALANTLKADVHARLGSAAILVESRPSGRLVCLQIDESCPPVPSA